jgi:hypothetical protein
MIFLLNINKILMTNYKDEKVTDNLKYLDKILETNLKLGNNYKIDVKKLAENINPYDFSFVFSETWADKLRNLFSKPKSIWENFENQQLNLDSQAEFNSEESKFINALLYLHKEELIIFTPYPINTSQLMFSGMIKLSSGGFYKEYRKQKRRDLYQNYAWIVAILTFIAGWIFKPLLEIIKLWLFQSC